MNDLDSEFKETKRKIAESEDEIKSLKSRLAGYIKQQEAATTKEERAQVQVSISSLDGRIAGAENNLAELRKQATKLQDNLEKLAAQGNTLNDGDRILKRARDTSTSTLAQPSKLNSIQTDLIEYNLPPYLIMGRPCIDYVYTPVQLLTPLYDQYLYHIKRYDLYVNTSYRRGLVKFMADMSNFYRHENYRADRIKNYFNSLFRGLIMFSMHQMPGSHSISDLVGSFVFPDDELIQYVPIILEVKNEISGNTSDPILQGIIHYDKIISGHMDSIQFNCPSFIISIIGHIMTIGLCFTVKIDNQIRTQYQHINAFSLIFYSYDDDNINQICSSLLALKHTFMGFQSSATSSTSSIFIKTPISSYPYFNSFTINNHSHVITYTKSIAEDNKLVYLGYLNNQRKVLVKFVRFSDEQHYETVLKIQILLFENNHTPELLYHQQLNNSNYYVFVYEYMSEYTTLNKLVLSEEQEVIARQQLKQSLSLIHNNGYVHGDLRRQNVMFSSLKQHLVLIDLEFSNTENNTYPLYSYCQELVDLGVDCGKPLTREVDIQGANAIFPNLF